MPSGLGKWASPCNRWVNALKTEMLTYPVLHADETPVAMLDPGKGKTHRAYLWSYSIGAFEPIKAVIYDFTDSRAGKHAQEFLDTWRGTLVCDDYAGHKALIADGVTEAIEVERERAGPLVEKFPVFAWDRKHSENPSGYIVDTLQAVFQSLFATECFEDCLIDVVNRGGDADTTGAIAGMLAGARYGLAAIPRRWLRGLDELTRVRCEKQAEALISLAGSPSS